MKKYISIFAVALAIGVTGCKKNYLSLETNPNQPSITTPDLLLPAALTGDAANYQSNYPQYGVWAGYWTTSGNYVPNQAINEYIMTTGSFDDWDDMYLNMVNWYTLENLGAANSSLANYEAIAKIMLAFDFEQLVDNYNDVPYSQAFNVKDITPAYDKGEDIYHDLGKQLDVAIKLIADNPNATLPTKSDVMFAGNMSQWQKFANTLKLRLAVRVYKKLGTSDPLVTDLASTASIGYLSSDAYINPGYALATTSSGSSQINPFYATYGTDVTGNATFPNNYYRANAYGVSYYSSNNDPRLSTFYLPINGAVAGNIFGDINHARSNSFISAIGTGLLKSASQNAVMISAFESDFLQAEAIQNNLIPASTASMTVKSAEGAYEQGITDSFIEQGLTAAQAKAYYGQSTSNINWTASSDKEQAIITQKWAAMNGWFNLEAYNEYRRTGFPNLPSSVDPSAAGHNLPTRIPYPTSELSNNDGNLAKEGTIYPGSSKIFWAQ